MNCLLYDHATLMEPLPIAHPRAPSSSPSHSPRRIPSAGDRHPNHRPDELPPYCAVSLPSSQRFLGSNDGGSSSSNNSSSREGRSSGGSSEREAGEGEVAYEEMSSAPPMAVASTATSAAATTAEPEGLSSGSSRPSLEGPLPIPASHPLSPAPLLPSAVFGPTCDGLDTVLQNCSLPDLAVGDWLLFPRMGAYTSAASSTFNGFPCAAAMPVFTCESQVRCTASACLAAGKAVIAGAGAAAAAVAVAPAAATPGSQESGARKEEQEAGQADGHDRGMRTSGAVTAPAAATAAAGIGEGDINLESNSVLGSSTGCDRSTRSIGRSSGTYSADRASETGSGSDGDSSSCFAIEWEEV